MATIKKAVAAKKSSTAVVKWDEALAARAKLAQKAESSVTTGSFISLKSGVMSFNGNVVPGNKLEVVVIDSILENSYYAGEFDIDNPAAPLCYAFGRNDDEMTPHENVVKAGNAQSELCSNCVYNEWASAEKGKGKACKNTRRLALITSDVLEQGPEAVLDFKEAFLKLPVTSVKAWAGYVNQLAATEKPPLAFVTEVSVTPDPKNQFKVSFHAIDAIEDGKLIEALLKKADQVEKTIGFPYPDFEPQPAKKAAVRPAAKRALPVAKKLLPAKVAAKINGQKTPAAKPSRKF